MTSHPSDQPEPAALRSSYVIPFGRVLGQNDGDPPVNEVLVGREDERAYFVNLLVSRGPTGSYLVTGRRGVGKSSFVRHCLTEYGAAVFKRFLRSNSGKSFWDFSILALLSFVSIVLAMSMSELSALLFLTSFASAGGRILQIVAVLLVILCLFPLVYARQIIETVLRTRPPMDPVENVIEGVLLIFMLRWGTWTTTDGRHQLLERAKKATSRFASPIASVLTAGVALCIWYVAPGGEPAMMLGRVYVALCGLHAFVHILSFQKPDHSGRVNQRRYQRREVASWIFFIVFALLEIQIDLFDTGRWLLESVLPVSAAPVEPETMAWLTLATGFVFLSGGNLARYVHVNKRWQRRLVMFGWRDGGLWYAFFSGAAALAAIFCLNMPTEKLTASDSRIVLLGSIAAVLFAMAVRLRLRQRLWERLPDERSLHFRPRPRMLLTLKAFCAVLVGLQLSYPGLAMLQKEHFATSELARWFMRPSPTALTDRCVTLPLGTLKFGDKGVQDRAGIGSPNGQKAPVADLGLFHNRETEKKTNGDAAAENGAAPTKPDQCPRLSNEEAWWATTLFLIIVFFYFVEYEWVVRPFINARDERSLDPARRPPWEDQEFSDVLPHQRFQYRQMERLTFPWMTFTTLLQTLSITVNLGFDKLDHRSVIQAMLVGLRHEYCRQFLAWHSGIANVIRVLFLAALLFFSGQLSRAWFALPALPEPGKDADAYRVASQLWEGKSLEEILGAPRGESAADTARPPAVPDLANLVYKKHPDDRSDRICRYYSDMEKYHLQSKREKNTDIPSEYFKSPPALTLLCSMEKSDFWISLLYFDVISVDINNSNVVVEKKDLLYWLFDLNNKLPLNGNEKVFGLRIYNILLIVSLYFSGRWLMYWLPLLPYRRNLSRVDDLLDSLSARMVQRRSSWKPAQWIHLVFGDGGASEIERAPADSRTIELAFLEILRDLQNGSVAFMRGTMQRLSIPAPEITFVFDELDKLGITIDAENSRTVDSPEDLDIMGAERQRSLALHRLMSDMKRILSAAPARFIFVGGRQLHDEWLADQTSRQPLLTSIFNAEVYLPSLLTDHGMADVLRDPQVQRLALHDRVREYLSLQHYLAIHNMGFWTSARWRPAAGLGLRWEQQESYFQPGSNGTLRSNIDQHWDRLRAANPFETSIPSRKREWEKDFLWSFVRFLTYRSAGNPKRLRELTLGFLQPVGRVTPDTARWANQAMACHEVLYFNDNAIFRIQFLDSVYRHLVDRFGSRLLQRDDKIAVSLFFITDFLFKFHRRAFAWSNLQRIEELVHIHRAPDLRLILEELVEHSTEHFLQPVLNGMYTFRFRSELSREIDYLSRCSEDDLAAFNFTLDESQSLKRPYMVGLRGANVENSEFFASVGELFEFDEEFDMARHHYRKAIALLDNDLDRLKGGGAVSVGIVAEARDWTTLADVLMDTEDGRRMSVAMMAWGMARLRLILQIGMTYEISRNAERAETEYRAAFVLAERLFDAYLDLVGDSWPDGSPPSEARDPDKGESMAWRFRTGHALKHMVLIYQPVFAIAWIAEKLVGDIDASTSIVEEYIDRLRARLPFVKEKAVMLPPESQRTSHSNFSLIIAELHRKAGDLYFFKGRQCVPLDRILELARIDRNKSRKSTPGPEGFLLRAHYHYIVTLHELRRHVQSRMISSTSRFNAPLSNGRKPHSTMLSGQHPSYIHLATGNALSDLADSMLSRVSLIGVLDWLAGGIQATSLHPASKDVKRDHSFGARFRQWFETESTLSEVCFVPQGEVMESLRHPDDGKAPSVLRLDDLSDWIGEWNCGHCVGGTMDRVSPGRMHWPHERLLMVLRLSELSADYSRRGGYREDAARKCMQACETVSTLFWWIAGLRRLAAGTNTTPGESTDKLYAMIEQAGLTIGRPDGTSTPDKRDYLRHLRFTAEDALRQAVVALEGAHLGRDGINRTPRGYLSRGTLSPHVLTLACSLYLSSSELFGKSVDQSRLHRLICQIAGEDRPENSREAVYDTLLTSIVRSRYPILNRLNALHALINSEIGGISAGAPPVGLQARQLRLDGHVREWLDLLDGFDAPLHFSPLLVGTTLIWFCLALAEHKVRPLGRGDDPADGTLRSRFGKHMRMAFCQLERSQQMHTMGQAYYETISGLYYLYDDFNDPHIHFHKSLQMAGSELISILRSESVRRRLDPEGFADAQDEDMP